MSESDPAAPREPPIAVAVVSWNTRELLGRSLETLKLDVDAGRAQVWVVDHDSSDGSPEFVRTKHPWAMLVTPGATSGLARR